MNVISVNKFAAFNMFVLAKALPRGLTREVLLLGRFSTIDPFIKVSWLVKMYIMSAHSRAADLT